MFTLGELFEFESIKQAKSQREIPNDDTINGIPYVVQSVFNNMVARNVNKNWLIENNEPPVSGNRIALGVTLPAVSYQSKEFGASQIITAKAEWLNEKRGLFIAISITKLMHQFSYGRKPGMQIYREMKIQLPTQNGEIDFAFMEQFIAELEAERIAELEAYLRVTGLSDYILTEEERAVLEAFRNGKISWGGVKLPNGQEVTSIGWKMFRIGELFEINSYKKRFDANKVQIEEAGFPYVVRTALNNGIRGYIKEDEEFLNEGNTISFGQDTATMFYQEKPYFTGDKIKIVKCKDESFNKLNAQFFITAMGKAFSSFSWGSSSFSVEIIKNQNISLPSTQGIPLYAYMEVFIRAVQKLVIKDVVQYAERKVAATRAVVK